MAKRATSLRLSDQARELLVKLSKKLGINQTSVLELAIRKLAEAEGIKPDER